MLGRILIAIYLLVVVAQFQTAHAEKLDTEVESARNRVLMAKKAWRTETYSLLFSESGTELKLKSRPAFNWIKIARPGEPQVHQSSRFFWTDRDPTEAVGTICSVIKRGNDPRICHELHPPSTQRCTPNWNSKPIGFRVATEANPTCLTGNPFPPTATGRLIQICQLPRRIERYRSDNHRPQFPAVGQISIKCQGQSRESIRKLPIAFATAMMI